MNIELIPLTQACKSELIALMSHPLVLKHMPLATESFNYDQFIEAKERIWEEHGYGPRAFVLNDQFVGWGGLQPEGDDVEIALVLHPDYWGMGRIIYKKIVHHAFKVLNLESVIVLLPPSRTRIRGVLQLGFEEDGFTEIEGKRFLRYRLTNLHEKHQI